MFSLCALKYINVYLKSSCSATAVQAFLVYSVFQSFPPSTATLDKLRDVTPRNYSLILWFHTFPTQTGTWQGLSHVFSLRGHFKCTHLSAGLLTVLLCETHSYSSWMDPNLKSFLLFQFKRTQKFRNIVLASVSWIRGETLTSPLLCVLPNHSLCHKISTVLQGDMQWWRKLPAGRAWSAQTRRELAAGSLEKGMRKSECLSLAGILINFVNFPSFPGTCLFSTANDDKLLPPDPQPTLYMACGLITITWNKRQ